MVIQGLGMCETKAICRSSGVGIASGPDQDSVEGVVALTSGCTGVAGSGDGIGVASRRHSNRDCFGS